MRRWPVAWRSGEAALATSGWAGLGVLAKGGDGEAVDGPAAGHRGRGGVGDRRADRARGDDDLPAGGARRGARTTGALAGLLDAGPAGPVVAEYTRDGGGPRELAFRVTAPGEREHEVVETVARLDLRVAANRAVAERLLRHRAPWPPAVARDLREAIGQAVRAGTVERSVYAVDGRDRGRSSSAARLGAEVGIEAGASKVDRRLVEASAWTAGSPSARERTASPTESLQARRNRSPPAGHAAGRSA